MSAMPSIATNLCVATNRHHVPCVDGSELARAFFRFAALVGAAMCSALDAVHMTAGHNALRGSGPGQKPAFENAVARVGCPDRRIDRLCITCCSSSQPSHHARVLGAISLDPQRGRIIVPRARSHHCPGHSRELVGKRMAASLVGRRASSAVSQGRCLVPWILA